MKNLHRLVFRLMISSWVSVALVAASPAWAEDAPERLAPLPEADWSPEVKRLLGGTRDRVATLEGQTEDQRKSGKTLNILRTLAHHPKLLGPFIGFATALAQEGTLSRRDSELLALRAAWNCQSEFEWGHHVHYGLAAGLSQAEIDRIPLGPSARAWSASDRALLEAADGLHRKQQIDDTLWRRLAERYSEAQLVEIPFVVGQYTMLSMVANMTGVVLEDEYPRMPSRHRGAR